MARYLTPSKIALLALVKLYADSVVPAASTIPVLSFIISHLLPSSLPQNSFPGSDGSAGRRSFPGDGGQSVRDSDGKRSVLVFDSDSGRSVLVSESSDSSRSTPDNGGQSVPVSDNNSSRNVLVPESSDSRRTIRSSEGDGGRSALVSHKERRIPGSDSGQSTLVPDSDSQRGIHGSVGDSGRSIPLSSSDGRHRIHSSDGGRSTHGSENGGQSFFVSDRNGRRSIPGSESGGRSVFISRKEFEKSLSTHPSASVNAERAMGRSTLNPPKGSESSGGRRSILVPSKEFERLLSTHSSVSGNVKGTDGRRLILVSSRELEKLLSTHPSALVSVESNDGRHILDSLKDLESSDKRSILDSPKEFERVLSAHPSASAIPGRSLWDLLLKRLWDIDSLDALHIFFERLPHLLAKSQEDSRKDSEMGIPRPSPEMIGLSRASPLGTFVLQSQLEFTRLKFHDALELWKSFVAYRHITLPNWAKRSSRVDSWSFDTVLQRDFGDQKDDSLGSFDTVIRRDLKEQGYSLEGFNTVLQRDFKKRGGDPLERLASISYGDIFRRPESAPGLISTEDVQKLLEFQIERMQKLGNRVPDSMQDRLKSVLNNNIMVPSMLHYVSFLDAWIAGDYSTSFDSLHRYFDYTMQNREKPFYQYALLNLAILQADFGCYQEAVAAIQETITTARENKDMACLNFSLSWLYHFGKSHPKVMNEADKTNMLEVEREGLAFLRAKTKESGMWSLWSSSLLSEAKMELSGGESIAAAFENILRSSHLTVTGNMMSDIGVQMMLQSSLWSRLGIAHLAWLNHEVFLRCHLQAAPFEDILKYTCRAAYFLTQKGRYDEAIGKLEWLNTNARRSLKANRYRLLFRGLVQLKRDVHRNDLDGADQLLAQLLLQCQDGDPDLSFELNTLHIDTMMRRGDYPNALAKIENLSTEVTDAGQDIFFRVKLLIMKAALFEKCGRPQKGFSVAVRAASIAWRARLLPVLWEAMTVIANILISLEEFEASSWILTSVAPRALECEDCALAARLFSSLVDAHMGMAGQAGPGSLKRMENLTTALDFVGRAFAEYSSIEDVKKQSEMMAKKATIMQIMGNPVLANDYAAAYLDIKRETYQM